MSGNGGPAFPVPLGDVAHDMWPDPGMSLRDYFAGQALPKCGNNGSEIEVARFAYAVADAMLAERDK